MYCLYQKYILDQPASKIKCASKGNETKKLMSNEIPDECGRKTRSSYSPLALETKSHARSILVTQGQHQMSGHTFLGWQRDFGPNYLSFLTSRKRLAKVLASVETSPTKAVTALRFLIRINLFFPRFP